jgi:Erv1 / Alr family
MQSLEQLRIKLPQAPEDFGPILWKHLHKHAKQNSYNKAWLDRFTEIIPCGSCKNSFKEFKHPVSEQNFFSWTVDAHNKVNKKLGKPIMYEPTAETMY